MAKPMDIYRRAQRELVSDEAAPGTLLRVLVESILAARVAMVAGNLEKSNRHLIAAQQVLYQLHAGVPENLGELGQNLSTLYAWSELTLGQANIKRDPSLIDAVVKVLGDIRDGFDGVPNAPAADAISS